MSDCTTRNSQRFVLVALVALVLGGGVVHAQETDAYLTPVAPPESGLGYEVPLPAWLVEASLEHRRAFIEGVAAEAVTLAESDDETGMGLVLSSAGELADVTQRLEGTMAAIGAIDSAFGIRGISRLVTAVGAVRDTLFGFVVWHESAAGESREVARSLEKTVDRLLLLGQAADRIGGELGASARNGRRALDKGEYAAIAQSAVDINENAANLGTVAAEVVAKTDELEQIVWEIRESGSPLLSNEWNEVLLATSEARRLAARMTPALEEATTSSLAFSGMATALSGVLETLELVEAAPRDDAERVAVPWKLFLRDQEIVGDMIDEILEMSELESDVVERVGALALEIVVSDRLLVEHGVIYTGNLVAGAHDTVEGRALAAVGYDEGDTQRRRLELLAEADRQLRENLELETALLAARSMRAAYEAGRAVEGGGVGTEKTALRHYKNAWLHSLNAGAMAQRASGE